MKRIILLNIIFFLSLITYSQDAQEKAAPNRDTISKELNWVSNYEKAKKLAKRKGKPLLIFFTGSDWCGPCKVLHKDFLKSDEFLKLADKELILYEANFPRRKDLITPQQKKMNFSIKRKFNINGYPTILILNSYGNEIARRSGYSSMMGSEYHFEMVKKAIEQN